jgi:hypothetical protein
MYVDMYYMKVSSWGDGLCTPYTGTSPWYQVQLYGTASAAVIPAYCAGIHTMCFVYGFASQGDMPTIRWMLKYVRQQGRQSETVCNLLQYRHICTAAQGTYTRPEYNCTGRLI